MLKALYEQGYDFDTFMKGDGGEHVDKVLNFVQLSSDVLTQDMRSKIKAVPSAHILVFGEVWCPDCMINMAALEVMHRLNAKIEYTVVPRESNEEALKAITPDKTAKIPTFVALSESWEAQGLFLEKPKVIKEVEAGKDQAKRIVVKRDYRQGKYLLEAMEELITLL